ncbi:ABC transporter substrate-binding protein [Pandoraea sp. ISTKB]|uniref:ABC transporter substrate-binding protein n=1 Tax=Pandoraea sp. ISTKB TaxID=1586708 RepID=UPI0009F6655E|nr:ABC transporter substrate-binding protein [Pandoraea sp. ISTKB]
MANSFRLPQWFSSLASSLASSLGSSQTQPHPSQSPRLLPNRLPRKFLALGAALAVAAVALHLRPALAAPASGDPVWVGVSGPVTGQNAQYGLQWKRGFDLALDDINGDGGIKGHPLSLDFQDSQSDPRQAVAIAQKFVGDPRILVELGDFSSPASMAASPIYQRGKLIQFGFTNSHPDFTKGGDYMWSTSISQAEEQPLLADFVVRQLGLKRVAVLYLNTDWGRTSKDLFTKAAEQYGAKVVAAEGYQPDEKDYRSTLVRVRDAKPDSLVLISYAPDGAQIVRQARQAGVTLPTIGASSLYSPKFLELGGAAAEGVHLDSNFFPNDPRPEVQRFVTRYRAKYQQEPDAFAARAYDALLVTATVLREFGASREAARKGFAQVKDAPSIVFGKVAFDPQTRRVAQAKNVHLIVRQGQFVVWQGDAPKVAAK